MTHHRALQGTPPSRSLQSEVRPRPDPRRGAAIVVQLFDLCSKTCSLISKWIAYTFHDSYQGASVNDVYMWAHRRLLTKQTRLLLHTDVTLELLDAIILLASQQHLIAKNVYAVVGVIQQIGGKNTSIRTQVVGPGIPVLSRH